MVALITLEEATAWAEQTKMQPAILTLDAFLLTQVESEVLARVSASYDTTTWVSSATTPTLVKTIIARLYISWLIDRYYSEDDDLSAYAGRLAAHAETLLGGIQDGSIEIPGIVNTMGAGQPSFYPTDASSASTPTFSDPSLGPSKFSMNAIF